MITYIFKLIIIFPLKIGLLGLFIYLKLLERYSVKMHAWENWAWDKLRCPVDKVDA
jgi:hypothetical protein